MLIRVQDANCQLQLFNGISRVFWRKLTTCQRKSLSLGDYHNPVCGLAGFAIRVRLPADAC